MLFTLIVVVAVAITENVLSVSGCSCSRTTDEQTYCKAEFVSLVYVLRKQVQNKEDPNLPVLQLNYTVFHIYSFKLPKAVTDLPSTVITQAQSSLCGVDYLEEGQCYLIAGTYDQEKNVLSISICGKFQESENEKWENILEKTKKSLLVSGIECKQ